MDKTELVTRARAAMEMAVAPSSKFRVGAALLCDDGSVFTGCNIESPTYLGICAERVALIQAIADGNSILTPTEAHVIVARLLACFIEQIYNLNGVCLTNKEE